MLQYGIVHQSIFASSLAGILDPELKYPVARAVFIDLIVLADEEGQVHETEEALARRLNLIHCPQALSRALEVLQNPDPSSRSKEHGGRRIAPLPGRGWQIINYQLYARRAGQRVQRVQRETPARSQRAEPARTRSYIDLDIDIEKAEEREDRAPAADAGVDEDRIYWSGIWNALKIRSGKRRPSGFTNPEKAIALRWKAAGIELSFARQVILSDSQARRSIKYYEHRVPEHWRERPPEQLEIPSVPSKEEPAVRASAPPAPAPTPDAAEPRERSVAEIARVVLGRELRPDEVDVASKWDHSSGERAACWLLYVGARETIKGTQINGIGYFRSGLFEGVPEIQLQMMSASPVDAGELLEYLARLGVRRLDRIRQLLDAEPEGDRRAALLAGIKLGIEWLEQREKPRDRRETSCRPGTVRPQPAEALDLVDEQPEPPVAREPPAAREPPTHEPPTTRKPEPLFTLAELRGRRPQLWSGIQQSLGQAVGRESQRGSPRP